MLAHSDKQVVVLCSSECLPLRVSVMYFAPHVHSLSSFARYYVFTRLFIGIVVWRVLGFTALVLRPALSSPNRAKSGSLSCEMPEVERSHT